MKQITLFKESPLGHEEVQVPLNAVPNVVKQELQEDKLVTIEKKNGETEVLSKNDIDLDFDKELEALDTLKKEDKVTEKKQTPAEKRAKTREANLKVKADKNEAWANKFKQVKSITSTGKARGG